MNRRTISKLSGLLTIVGLAWPTVSHAYSEDVCPESNPSSGAVAGLGNCMKDAACRGDSDSVACSVNAMYMSGAATAVVGGRSVVHLDATYALAVGVGFAPDVAYWIAAYDEVADQSKYVHRDLCASTSTVASLSTERVIGFDRNHPTFGGFPYHFGTFHSPNGKGTDTTRLSGLFPWRTVTRCEGNTPESAQSQNCMYSKGYSPEPFFEGTSYDLRRWAWATGGLSTISFTTFGGSPYAGKSVSGTAAVCMGGFDEVTSVSGSSSYFLSDKCLGGQADEGQTEAPVDVRGCMPLINVGTQSKVCVDGAETDSGLGNVFHSKAGNQVIAEQDGKPLLYSHELETLLASDSDGDGNVGKLWLTAPNSTVPAAIASLGIYLHVLQDRISHHECGDESFSAYGTDSKGGFVEYHYDGALCGQDEHAKGHFEEIGQTSLPLRSYMGLEYTYDELLSFAKAVCASKDPAKTAWLPGKCNADGSFAGATRSREALVGKRVSAAGYYNGADVFVEGSVTKGLKPAVAKDRILAIREAIKAFGGTPLPGTEVTCK